MQCGLEMLIQSYQCWVFANSKCIGHWHVNVENLNYLLLRLWISYDIFKILQLEIMTSKQKS